MERYRDQNVIHGHYTLGRTVNTTFRASFLPQHQSFLTSCGRKAKKKAKEKEEAKKKKEEKCLSYR